MGRQWEGLKRPKGSQEPIVFNIVKPIVKYKINIINQNTYKIIFNPNTYETQDQLKALTSLTKGLNQFMEKMIEKTQFGKKVKALVKNACINSEGIMYFYIEENEKEQLVQTEEIDKNNIYYGNENTSDIQDQPYILVTYRKPVSEVRDRARILREAGENNLSEEDILSIQSDMDFMEQQGYEFMQTEVVPMCLCIKKFERREDGKIWVSESTKTCDLMSPKSTDCELYPFAHFIWEQEKGYARGVSEVTGLLENQREINKTATRRAIAVKIGAYPKLVANTEYIKNTEALGTVGSTIEVNGGLKADDVRKVANYLNPTTMSPDAYNLQQDLINQTRDLAGAGDTATGQVDPEKTSGRAILLVQQASQQPLNEQLDNYKYFLEDGAKIIFEMIKVYYINGLTLYNVRDEINELGDTETFEEPYKISQKDLEKADINLKVDISSTGVYDINNQIGTLENLLMKGIINIEEFTKALPDADSNNKAMLEQIIRDRKEARKQITAMQQQINATQSAINQLAIENGGGMDEMSTMQVSGNAGGESTGQQPVQPM